MSSGSVEEKVREESSTNDGASKSSNPNLTPKPDISTLTRAMFTKTAEYLQGELEGMIIFKKLMSYSRTSEIFCINCEKYNSQKFAKKINNSPSTKSEPHEIIKFQTN